MTQLHRGYFAFPVLNTHPSRGKLVLSYKPLCDLEDERVQQFRADYARRGRTLQLARLVEPSVHIAKGRESTIVPKAFFPSGLSFFERVLATVEKDKECALDEKVKARLRAAAEDRHAEDPYVVPADFRMLAHDGKIDEDIALALTKTPCDDGKQTGFSPWTKEFELQLDYRNVQQVLLKVEFDGPCILEVAIDVLSYSAKVRVGSFLVPFLDDRFDAG